MVRMVQGPAMEVAVRMRQALAATLWPQAMLAELAKGIFAVRRAARNVALRVEEERAER